jgi:pantoate--beta-alanine ligase
MKIFKNKHKLQKEILSNKNISFVPTMGGLHKGHISLVKKSKILRGKTLVSIFVNPKQFNKKSDYNTYPRNLSKDLKILKKLKTDYVYLPDKNDLFNFKTKNNVHMDNFVKKLCGRFRKGHFEGVVNVVNRFVEIIQPKNIFFGLKDYQQFYLVKKHFMKNKIWTNIILCKTIRDKNGLAYSTRNNNLNPNQLAIGAKVYKYLVKAKHRAGIDLKIIKKDLTNLGVTKIDYVELYNLNKLIRSSKKNSSSKIFIAYYLDKVRLIDNI